MRKILFVHIEKTAGTSVMSALRDTYGSDVWGYNHERDEFSTLNPAFLTQESKVAGAALRFLEGRAPGLRSMASKVVRSARGATSNDAEHAFANAHAITGHMRASLYAEQAKNAGFEIHSVMREPLERVWSHYKFWQEQGRPLGNEYCGVTARMRFQEFALSNVMTGFQSTRLDIPREDIDVLGTTEDLTGYLKRANLIRVDGVAPVANQTHDQSVLSVSDAFRSEFVGRNAADYELWNHAAHGQSDRVT